MADRAAKDALYDAFAEVARALASGGAELTRQGFGPGG